MFKLTFAVVITTATTALAGVLYLELPPSYDAEMVYHPTDEDLTKLHDFVSYELGKLDNEYTCRVIILTKNGKPVLRDFGQQRQQDIETKPTLAHVHFNRGSGWSDKKWDDLWYHLHWVGAPNYYGVYGIAYTDVFGPAYAYDTGYYPPVIEREVDVVLDPDAPTYGYYLASLEEIYLKDWRIPEGGSQEEMVWADTDRAYFTRLMLHAFRGPWPATWDHFGAGTVHAAWLEIQARLYRDGYETHFNDLGHYEKLPNEWDYQRPHYTYYENYNVNGLATAIASFDSSNCHLKDIIRVYRYGACGYCWWKVLHHDPDFIKEWNGELCKLWRLHWPDRPSYEDLYWAAVLHYNGGPIEEKTFTDWFAEQPILSNAWGFEYVCVPLVSKSRVEIFNYERNFCPPQGEPAEYTVEAPGPDEKVIVKKKDWNGSEYEVELHDFSEGYAVWHPPMVSDNGKFTVNSAYWKWYVGPWWEWRCLASGNSYGVNTDEAYQSDEIFAVVADAVNGGGWLQVSYNGTPLGSYEVVKYVARVPNFPGGDEAGAGEYTFSYVPPEGKGYGSNSADPTPTICKDGGCFFDHHSYLSTPGRDAAPGDYNLDNARIERISPSAASDIGFGASLDQRLPSVRRRLPRASR